MFAVLLTFYIGFGVGAYRTDFLLKWHLAPGLTGRLLACLWYMAVTVGWLLHIAANHAEQRDMLRAVVEKYK